MGGYKTWLGGLSLILPGVLQALTMAQTGYDFNTLQQSLMMIGAGLSAIGIGHKVEKSTVSITNALHEATGAIESLQVGAATLSATVTPIAR